MKRIIEATGSVVLIKQDQTKEKAIKTKDGKEIKIHIAESAVVGGSMEEFSGVIVAKGPAAEKFAVGDRVTFGRNSGSIKKFYGEELWLCYEHALSTRELLVPDDQEITSEQYVVEKGVN